MWSGKDDAETIRKYGHALIDRIAEYLEEVPTHPVSTPSTAAELEPRFSEPLPREGRDAGSVWDEFWESIARDSIHLRHPMYMGHQVAPPLPHALLADAVVSLFNQSVSVWEMSPTASLVETQVIGWMLDLIGFPPGSDGTFVSGGSVANMTGLLAARAALFPDLWRRGFTDEDLHERLVIFASAQSHYSMERAAGVLGFGSDAIYPVPDRGGKMDPIALDRTIEESRREGRIPLAIVATAGCTPTGLFDDLDQIADIAERSRIWLHVDGAHGASFIISDELRSRVHGIERADSVAWDPHKMMFMPISMGAILIRDHRHLDNAFQESAPYLFHTRPGESRSLDQGRRTLQGSRRFDALKLWVTLRHHGSAYFGNLLEKTVATTELLYQKLEEAPDFEAMHEPESNILCFRYLPDWLRVRSPEEVDLLQRELREAYNASGRGWITTTVLGERRVLRVTLMNPATGEGHLDELLVGLREVAAGLPVHALFSGIEGEVVSAG